MYPITNAVKALFEADQKKVLRITGTDSNNTSISITDDNVIAKSFNVDRYSCIGEKLEIGTAVAAEMSFKLNNFNGAYDAIVFEGTELFVEIGIADWTQTTPSVSYIPCGYFTPDKQPRKLSAIAITGLDRMTRFDRIVDASVLSFPTTVHGLVGQVCTICNVPMTQDITGLVNATVSLTGLPSIQQDITYRNLIQWCAGIMATNAWIDWEGKLRFSWYNNATGYVSTKDNRYKSDLYENNLSITGAQYTNNSGITIVSGTDDYAIDLTGNYLASDYIATILPAINTALNGFTYRPFTASVVGAPYLWPMDAVTFTDKDNNTVSTILTNVSFGLNGNTAIEARGMTYAINQMATPVGFTKDQAQLVEEVAHSVEVLDDSLTQQEIFNRLTDNGAAQGLVLYNGQLYMNATYINTGTLTADRISLNTYNPDFLIPDENDSSTLLPNQSISNGWVVQTGTSVTVLEIPEPQKYWGKTIEVSATSIDRVSSGTVSWYTDDDPGALTPTEEVVSWNAPTYGAVSADGTLTGATMNGTGYKYTRRFTVPNTAVSSYRVAFVCNGVKAITVSTGVSSELGLRYAQNISIDSTGLQVGKFVVNRTGDATFNGDTMFNGPVSMNGRLTFTTTNAIAYQGTKNLYNMISFIDNPDDIYGNGIAIGGGGATIIGGGESAGYAAAQLTTGGDEILFLCNDGDVKVYTNMQNGWASRKTFTFGANGTLTIPDGSITINNTQYGDNKLNVANEYTSCTISLSSVGGQNPLHGLVSNGYWNGSSFVSDNRWILWRNKYGEVNLDGNITGNCGGITGTWDADIYDYQTKKLTLKNNTYYKIGPLYVMIIYVSWPSPTTFSQMFQIRNLPCSWCLGGTVYAASVNGQLGDRTIQSSDVGVYVRPNFTGTISSGVFSAVLFGVNAI